MKVLQFRPPIGGELGEFMPFCPSILGKLEDLMALRPPIRDELGIPAPNRRCVNKAHTLIGGELVSSRN